MGSSLSTTKSDDLKFTLLIGKLDRKSPLEQKFYMLSKGCLLSTQASNNSPTNSCENEADKPANIASDSMSLECSANGITEEANRPRPEHPNEIPIGDQNKMSSTLLDDHQQKSGSGFKTDCTNMKNPLSAQWDEVKQLDNNAATENTYFKPILGTKQLWCTQTYRSWHAIMDIEKIFYRNRKTIYLVQIDEMPDFIVNFTINFDHQSVSLFELLKKFIELFYDGLTVKWLDTIDTKQKKWKITSRIHKKTKQKQHLVKDIFPYLKKLCPSDGYGVLALTWTDLYPSEDMNFVLGEASNQQKACVVSFGRWEPKGFDPCTHQDLSAVDTHVLWKLFKVNLIILLCNYWCNCKLLDID